MSDPNDLLSEVEDRAANLPQLWDPESKLDRDDVIRDASVVGIIEEIDSRESAYGRYRNTVLRRRDGSRVSVAWFGTVLESRSKNLAVGDAVAISYLGRVQPNDPSLDKYANYYVVHRKPATGPQPVADAPTTPDTDAEWPSVEPPGYDEMDEREVSA